MKKAREYGYLFSSALWTELLNAVRRRFPELALTGISFRLSRSPLTPRRFGSGEEEGFSGGRGGGGAGRVRAFWGPQPRSARRSGRQTGRCTATIKDEKLRTALQRLEQHICARNGRET